MNDKNKIPDFITYARSFEKYAWYKPLLVLLVGFVTYFILQAIVISVFSVVYGFDVISPLLSGSYSSLNSELGSYISYLSVALFIPSLYVASRIVKDRPFSSYSSSRGGWNWKLYFKCLLVPSAIYLIFYIIHALTNRQVGPSTLTVTFFMVCLVIVPLQCIAEEYLLRGFVMQTIGSWVNIPVLAWILQAVLFALMHPYNILGVIDIFIDGLVLGLLAWKTNGLEPGSAFHSVNNFSAAMIVALGLDVSTSMITATDFLTSLLLTLISAFALYYVGNKQGWFDEMTS